MWLIIVGIILFFIIGLYYKINSDAPKITKNDNKRIINKPAGTAYIFAKAIAKSVMGKKTKSIIMPDVNFIQKNISLNATNVSKYRKICGFSQDSNEVPLSYPYLIIFPIQSLLLIDPSFPFPAMGIIHLANNIQQFKIINIDTIVTASVRFDSIVLPHAKGYVFNVISEIYESDGTTLMWRSTSTYLYRTRVSKDVDATTLYESKIKTEDVDTCKEIKSYKCPVGFGLKYAAISGDYNPIHLYALTAKMFGFPRGAIVHGMWSNGTCVAALMPALETMKSSKATTKNSDTSAFAEIYVEFKMPMYMPATGVLTSRIDGDTTTKDTTQLPLVNTNAIGSHKEIFQIEMKKSARSADMVPHVRGYLSYNA